MTSGVIAAVFRALAVGLLAVISLGITSFGIAAIADLRLAPAQVLLQRRRQAFGAFVRG